MNIHINKSQYEELKKGTILSIKMGSSLYGTEVKSSDTDYLHIFAHNSHWESSFIWTHHNFQYKEEKIDHIFVSLKDFVRNLLKGDSTINYECIFSKEIKNSKELSFLYDFRKNFNSYSVIRAYLGLVRRDLKNFNKSYDTKKLFHAIRGLHSAKLILSNDYSNELKDDQSLFEYLMKIRKNHYSKQEMINIMIDVSKETQLLRDNISNLFAKKQINRLMNFEDLKKLDDKIIKTLQSNWYKQKMIHNFEFEKIYEIIETDIEYE